MVWLLAPSQPFLEPYSSHFSFIFTPGPLHILLCIWQNYHSPFHSVKAILVFSLPLPGLSWTHQHISQHHAHLLSGTCSIHNFTYIYVDRDRVCFCWAQRAHIWHVAMLYTIYVCWINEWKPGEWEFTKCWMWFECYDDRVKDKRIVLRVYEMS